MLLSMRLKKYITQRVACVRRNQQSNLLGSDHLVLRDGMCVCVGGGGGGSLVNDAFFCEFRSLFFFFFFFFLLFARFCLGLFV